MLKVVVFDMDDTLFPEHQFVRSGFHAVSKYLEDNFNIRGFFDKAWKLFLEGNRGRIFNQVLDDIQYDSDSNAVDSLVSQMLNVYRLHQPEIKLFEDAQWALEHYAENFPLILLSDGYLDVQKNKATALGIKKYFKKFYFTDHWGRECWKPSSCAFEKIEDEFFVNGKECVYISDNPAKDFVAPNLLGWESIWINRKNGEYQSVDIAKSGEPKKTISSLLELKGILV